MIAQKISELLDINNKIWHEATKIKTFDNKPKEGLSSEERVAVFFKVREYNTERSKARAAVDYAFNDGVDERKRDIGC